MTFLKFYLINDWPNPFKGRVKDPKALYVYSTPAIITIVLYVLNPLFEGQKQFFKEEFIEN